MGKFEKGELNSNSEHLLELVNRQNLVLTNTLFDQVTGNKRNPIRNQIEYIIMKKEHRIFVQDSHSYSGIETSTDHKLVMAILKIDWKNKTPAKSQNTKKIDVSRLQHKHF